jgi:hypothetical protein
MSLVTLFSRCVSRPAVRPKRDREADRLIAAWGSDASEMARILQFRARAGLLHEDQPGFWASVALSIGHKIGVPDDPRLGANLLTP